MRHTRATLSARLSKLEAAKAAFMWDRRADVRIFDEHGNRLNPALPPPPPGTRRLVLNVRVAGNPTAAPDEVFDLPFQATEALEDAAGQDVVQVDPLPQPAPELPAQPGAVRPTGPFVLGPAGDDVVTLGEALYRAEQRARGEWRG